MTLQQEDKNALVTIRLQRAKETTLTAHTHSGVINQFGLHFVTKGIISKEKGKFLKQLFELRQNSDYNDWFIINEKDVKSLFKPAEDFIAEIENLINIC